jgi:hypothetical protein
VRFSRTLLGVIVGVAITAVVIVAPSGALSNKAAVAEAKKALIVHSDFPTGWTVSPSDNSNNNDNTPGLAQLAACLGVPKSVVNYNPPQAYSPDFDQNKTGLSVYDDVEVFPSVTILNQQFGLYTGAKSPGCLAAAFNTPSVKAELAKSFGAGVTVGTITSSTGPRPAVKDEAAAIGVTIPILYNGTKETISVVMVFIVHALRGAELTFTSASGLPFPAALATHLELVTNQRLG